MAAPASTSTEVKPQINLNQIKFDICCAARILYRQGMSVANAGHISVAIAPDRMLMNRFGPSFATLHPNDILTLDFRGNIVEDHTAQKNARVNETVELHGVIHRCNPQIACALHPHPPATVTWSAFRKVPEIYDQESCILAGDVAVVERTTKAWPRAKTACAQPHRRWGRSAPSSCPTTEPSPLAPTCSTRCLR